MLLQVQAERGIAIISCETKSEIDAFQVYASNPYDDKANAEKVVKGKLISDHKKNHLNCQKMIAFCFLH
jgi:hypothetical protein